MSNSNTMTMESSTQHKLRSHLAGKRIHFVGIGGCGMSGLARLAKRLGAVCTGSDHQASATTEALAADDIDVTLEQTCDSVPGDCELLVASAAIKEDHPEKRAAIERGVKMMKYAEMLGELMRAGTGVAIAGTHGKSTTTSMLSHVLIQAGLDPSFIVGANCRQIGGGSRCSASSDLLLAEACEYDRSFHHLHPKHAVILNVEADHLDIYNSLDEIVESFAVFAGRLPKDGSLLINHELSHRLAITAGLDCAVETIGFAPQADWRIELAWPSAGDAGASQPQPRTILHGRGEVVTEWPSPIPGEHMAYNAAVAAVMAHRLGAEWDAIAAAVASFEGLDRRMQVIGTAKLTPRFEVNESAAEREEQHDLQAEVEQWYATAEADGRFLVIDDYGHHPTEIETTLRALRQHYRPRRLICVFQPHQHSRTRFLMEQFASSFQEADVVIVPEIYFVRDSEQERAAVNAQDLVDRLRERGCAAMHLSPLDAIVEHLQVIAQGGDLIVTMGAGDVWQVARALVG